MVGDPGLLVLSSLITLVTIALESVSFKDNIPVMFDWHHYVVTDHRLRHHDTRSYTDDSHEWIVDNLASI